MSKRVCYSRSQVISWLANRFPELDLSELEAELPALIWRAYWNRLSDKFGLPYSRKVMANLDSRGEGPANIESE